MSCGEPHATPCSEIDAHLDQYLDKELTLEDVVLLEQHFRECPPCADDLTRAKIVQRLVARACGCSAPERLRARVVQRMLEIRDGDTSLTVQQTTIVTE